MLSSRVQPKLIWNCLNWKQPFDAVVPQNNIDISGVGSPPIFSFIIYFQLYYHYSFHKRLIVFTINEHENICIRRPNRRAGYATD